MIILLAALNPRVQSCPIRARSRVRRRLEVPHRIGIWPWQEALDGIVQPIGIEALTIGNSRRSPSHGVSWREDRIKVTRGTATVEAERDRGSADQENLRPLADGVEFQREFSEQPADVLGGKRPLSHTRLRAPAVMKTPLVRKDGGDS
jgi:hypothetical protein